MTFDHAFHTAESIQGEEPEEPENEAPLTDVEKRIEWICSDWADAHTNDNYDDWAGVRNSLHGALQTLIYCRDRSADYRALDTLNGIAFEHTLDCIRRDRFEGAAA